MRSSTPHVCRETVSHGAHKILTFNRCTWSLWTVFNLCWPKALLWLQFPIWVRAGSTCVFLGQLSSKVDPGVLAHIINLPAKCQVRCEISADSCSPYPTFFCFSRHWPESLSPRPALSWQPSLPQSDDQITWFLPLCSPYTKDQYIKVLSSLPHLS